MRIYFSSFFIKGAPLTIPAIFLAVFITIVFSFTGCKEDPSLLGRDILPPGDNMYVKIDSSTFVSAYSVSGKHIVTTANTNYPIGCIKDSIFGYSTAGIVAQYIPTALAPPNVVLSVDSIFLTLSIAGSYGDTVTPQTIRVYELTEQLRRDTVYYSDYDITGKYDLVELGSALFSPKDSVIKIRLTREDYLGRFIALNDSVYETIDNFVNVFKGFYIKTDDVSEKGGFAIINSQVLSTRLDMYYNYGGTGSNSYTMYFAASVAKFNVFSHDYNSYPVKNHLDVPGNDSILFIEGLAGVSVRLKFPDLDTFLVGKKVAINKASLFIPVENSVFGTQNVNNFPVNLMLFMLEDNGDYHYLDDYIISNGYFSGIYDASKKAYIFNIGLHLQSYIARKSENRDLILVSYRSSDSPNRVVLNGTGGKKSKMKLMVTYTLLP
jgi:hypothetical protein